MNDVFVVRSDRERNVRGGMSDNTGGRERLRHRSLAQRIRFVREINGLGRDRFADKLGVGARQLANWEDPGPDSAEPNEDQIKEIAEAAGVSPAFLRYGDDHVIVPTKAWETMLGHLEWLRGELYELVAENSRVLQQHERKILDLESRPSLASGRSGKK